MLMQIVITALGFDVNAFLGYVAKTPEDIRHRLIAFQVMAFAGIGRRRCGFLANCFCDFFELEAAIFALEMIEGG